MTVLNDNGATVHLLNDGRFFTTGSIAYTETTNPFGPIAGLQAGYNWQASASRWVFGVEADFQGTGETASGNSHQAASQAPSDLFEVANPPGPPATISFNSAASISQNDSLLWFGTVRARAGYAILPATMLYGTGGLAYGRLNESVNASFNVAAVCSAPCTGTATLANGTVVPLPFGGSQIFDASVTRVGWIAGGGIEGAVPNTRVTWKVEYLFMDLGTANYTLPGPSLGTIAVNTRFTDNIVRVGLNYHFH